MCEGINHKQSGFEQTVAIKELKSASYWRNKSVRLLVLAESGLAARIDRSWQLSPRQKHLSLGT